MQKISKHGLLKILVKEEREVRIKFNGTDEIFQGKIEYKNNGSNPGYYIGDKQIPVKKIMSPVRMYNGIVQLELK